MMCLYRRHNVALGGGISVNWVAELIAASIHLSRTRKRTAIRPLVAADEFLSEHHVVEFNRKFIYGFIDPYSVMQKIYVRAALPSNCEVVP